MGERKWHQGSCSGQNNYVFDERGANVVGVTGVAHKADVPLISAAPELLAALELCLKNSEFRRASGVESGPMIEREIEVARAAVNKAKGV